MRFGSLIGAAVLLLAQTAAGASLPPKFSYTIYIQGQPAGHCDVTVSHSGKNLVLSSKTTLTNGPRNTAMTCRTFVDPATYTLRRFEYTETPQNGKAYTQNVAVLGDSVTSTLTEDGTKSSTYIITHQPKELVLQDYVMEHHVLMALALRAAHEDVAKFGLIFPRPLSETTVDVVSASRAEMESDYGTARCVKYIVQMKGSQPYAIFFDEKRGVPVYMAFPATSTEAFLDDFYKDSPVTRYR